MVEAVWLDGGGEVQIHRWWKCSSSAPVGKAESALGGRRGGGKGVGSMLDDGKGRGRGTRSVLGGGKGGGKGVGSMLGDGKGRGRGTRSVLGGGKGGERGAGSTRCGAIVVKEAQPRRQAHVELERGCVERCERREMGEKQTRCGGWD
ncbi:glycine-rich protein 5-like [Sorghum bicolor]|uniref:glycine-rich protein 5-like n=1 Tax=Sorghum bicolor TaxID=4558 RepID=UPI000B4238A4|nr:glycine-rich protein 5-like [Sorghum bicolor]|eukprot:XP_021321415.1 glycine-rich protein 5-like [Sorghum bicolor]